MVEELLDKLEKVRSTGKDKWKACCPVHGDRNPSMDIEDKDGKVLVHCKACNANGLEVVQALGLSPSVLFEKALERGYIPKRIIEEIELDRLVVRIAEEDKKRGKPLSYNDFNRLRVAKNRIMAYEERLLEQNSLNKVCTS